MASLWETIKQQTAIEQQRVEATGLVLPAPGERLQLRPVAVLEQPPNDLRVKLSPVVIDANEDLVGRMYSRVGRPRVYRTNADRQRAYRDRVRQQGDDEPAAE